mmetsp:Transcript_10171/g.17283  ORF Transcript_10171/g.17283 Transcript_10171/m.17283 type:complete len:82 (+) Transcript_10171:68-313(+)
MPIGGKLPNLAIPSPHLRNGIGRKIIKFLHPNGQSSPLHQSTGTLNPNTALWTGAHVPATPAQPCAPEQQLTGAINPSTVR